jgi:CelD/BcsL family acetyltransferase involved in cellulose biosynthesis
MTTRILNDTAELLAIEGAWRELCALDPASSPFQFPGWVLPWWRRFGSGQLFCPAVFDGASLVGLAPFFLHQWNGRRQLTFLGNGVSDRLGILAAPGGEEEIYSCALRALEAERSCWDLADLQDIPEGLPVLACPVPPGLISATRVQYRCSSLRLEQTWQAMRAQLGGGLPRNLDRYRRQLAALGDLRFGTACPRDFDSVMSDLFRLHEARWEAKAGTTGVLGEAQLKEFHAEAAQSLHRRGAARLTWMRLDGCVIAANYVLLDRGRAYGYMAGFSPHFAKYNPGSLMLAETIQCLIGEGATCFDFLRGSEPYKAAWGARPYQTFRLMLWHDRAPADLL